MNDLEVGKAKEGLQKNHKVFGFDILVKISYSLYPLSNLDLGVRFIHYVLQGETLQVGHSILVI